MSISPISANPPVFQPNPQQNQMMQDFGALSSALQSGNLANAQQAFQTLMQDNPQAGNQNSPNNPFQQTLASIGSALQKGDLSGAQSAMSSLQQNMKAHHGHHHHHQATDQAQNATGSQTAVPSPLSASSSLINTIV